MILTENKAKEFEYISKAYEQSGGKIDNLLAKDIVSIVVSGSDVIGRNTVDGVHIDTKTDNNFVYMKLVVDDNIVLKKPIHLCVGYLKDFGEQNLEFEIKIGKNSRVNFISHCTFPASKNIYHNMVSNITLDEGAESNYTDVHYHNDNGFVNLNTKYFINIGKKAKFDNRFSLTQTRVGKMNILMNMNLDDYARAYAETKVKEKFDDKVNITEIIKLNGKSSSGMAKTYVIGQDESDAEVFNEVYGIGDDSKGHIECDEIIAGRKVKLTTIPKLEVINNTSEITHEASVGKINSEQLETLMSKGLNEEEASQMIIDGILSD